MKIPFFAILVIVSALLCAAWTTYEREPRRKLKIHGTVCEWNPNQKQYRDTQRDPKSFPVAITLYARRINYGYHGVMPICDTIVSDSLGNFTTYLENGEYNLFESWQLEPLVIPADSAWIIYDTACIRELYLEPAFKLRISGDDSVDVMLFPRTVKNLRCRKQ